MRQPQGMCVTTLYMLSTRHYTIVTPSSRHHHDIVQTLPLYPRRIADICDISLSHADGSPAIADSKSTSLTDVAPINLRIFRAASIRRNVGDTSSKVRQYIACVWDHTFDIGTRRHQDTSFSSPDMLALVAP